MLSALMGVGTEETLTLTLQFLPEAGYSAHSLGYNVKRDFRLSIFIKWHGRDAGEERTPHGET